MAADPSPNIPTLSEIRNETLRVFGRRPCLWQLKATEAILKNDKDVICISGTGSGKTLTFWMPLLFRKSQTQIVVTPLNILGKQNVEQLARVGIDAVSITMETATPRKFKEIEDGKYRAVVINPEILLKNGGEFETMWKNRNFVSRVLSFVWDEAHCISTWNEFRGKYKEANCLRYLIPRDIPFFLASAMLPTPILADIMDILQIRRDNHVLIQCSNDRPNVHLTVRQIQYPLTSYQDLKFLIADDWHPGQSALPKFIIFFDNIPDSIAAADYLRSRLPEEYRDKIKWFNADMMSKYREAEVNALKDGEIWGLCCTDSFGMGIDLPDIEIVVQWCVSCSMCTLWQRFGHGARDPSRTAKAVLFAESKYFDQEKTKKADAKARRAEKAATKRKAEETLSNPVEKVVVVGAKSKGVRRRALPAQQTPSTSASTSMTLTHSIAIDVRQPSTAREIAMRQCAEWRDLYFQPIGAHQNILKSVAQVDMDDLEPALDDLVNAETRPWKCFRIPSMVYFGNDKLSPSSHIECLSSGCPRCGPPLPPQACCQLCTPSAFADISFSSPTSQSKQATANSAPKGTSRYKREFKMDARDVELRRALHRFRKAEMLKQHGRAVTNNFGAAAIMPTDVLERLVACAHANRIETLEHLRREVKWDGVERYGEQVLRFVSDHCAAAPPHPAPSSFTTPGADCADRAPALVIALSPTESNRIPRSAPDHESAASSSRGTVKNWTCGKCGAKGHTSRSKMCPMHPRNQACRSTDEQPAQLQANENIAPAQLSLPSQAMPSLQLAVLSGLSPYVTMPTTPPATHVTDPISTRNTSAMPASPSPITRLMQASQHLALTPTWGKWADASHGKTIPFFLLVTFNLEEEG